MRGRDARYAGYGSGFPRIGESSPGYYTSGMDAQIADQIHTLWDELADFDAADADGALDHLLSGLCKLVDAQNADWFGAVRLADTFPGDPAHGWRPRSVHYLHPSRPIDEKFQEQLKQLNVGVIDETTVRNIALAGTFRVNRLADLAPESWFQGDYYRLYYRGVGYEDAIWAGIPLNVDTECYFGIFRDCAHPRFTPEERDCVAYALRGLKWFIRRQMLSRSISVATAPLTATEREVLGSLLTGQTEKQIAALRQQSPHTTHEHVTSIYRKFGVSNRSALMALWLGKAS